MAYLIDISYAQPSANLDWPIIAQNVDGVIIRAGQNDFMDALFLEHYSNAIRYGIPASAYWFYQPDLPPNNQIVAIRNVLGRLKDKSLPDPGILWIDCENISYPGVNITPPNADTFSWWLNVMRLGLNESHPNLKLGIYTRADYWDVWVKPSNSEVRPNGHSQSYTMPYWDRVFDLWIASWNIYTPTVRLPRDWKSYKIWQYEGGTGRTTGVTGPVDQNKTDMTRTQLVEYFGNGTIVPPSPTPEPEPEPEPLPSTLAEDVHAIRLLLERVFK